MITVKDIFRHGEDYLNKEIELFGWVRKIRDQKKFGFIFSGAGKRPLEGVKEKKIFQKKHIKKKKLIFNIFKQNFSQKI